MEMSEKECFESSPCEIITDGDEDEREEKNESFEAKDGGSSSNSTLEESEKKPPVRPYVRSKMPRLRWTPELHLRFIHAVERLGGQDRATPKLVLQLMGIKGMNIAHVKSHLQMYRSKKTDESNQGLKDQRMFTEGLDRNIFNLSQLPLLPSFNQRPLRYGDPSCNANMQWMHSTPIGLNARNITRSGLYTERILSNHYTRPTNVAHHLSPIFPSLNQGSMWRGNEQLGEEIGLMHKQEPWLVKSKQNPIEIESSKLQMNHMILEKRSNPPNISQITSHERIKGLKRKASDVALNLNLSLGLKSRSDEDDEDDEDVDDDDNELVTLSLYTMLPEASKDQMMKKTREEIVNVGNEKARWASTLDLTL